jgi:hypothetical protein
MELNREADDKTFENSRKISEKYFIVQKDKRIKLVSYPFVFLNNKICLK